VWWGGAGGARRRRSSARRGRLPSGILDERVCFAIDLRQPAVTIDWLSALLDAREHAHAAARRGDAVRRYVVAHGALRLLLAERLDTDPRALPFVQTCAVCGSHEHGRPPLALDGAPSFSLSHSSDVAVVAVSPETVGVDVEVVRPRRYLDRVAMRTVTDSEFAQWRALPEPEQLAAFLGAWTAKEAYLKMLGVGLTRNQRDVPMQDSTTWTDWPPGAITSVVATAPRRFERRDWRVPW
jgi:4'-phosphopantetheinyl transferase